MKRVTDLLTALVFISLIVFISCKKGDDGPSGPTPEEETLALLLGTWELESASESGTEREEWEGFSITISESSITASGIPNLDGASDVWSTNSTWDFGDAPSIINREDGITMNIAVTETQLTVSNLTISGSSNRISGFSGVWKFVFTKQ